MAASRCRSSTLAPGAAALWDGRFWVSVAKAYAGGPLKVRALGEASLRDLRRRRLVAEGASRGAATVPALWRGDEIVAAPSLGFWSSAHARDQIDAVFLGLGTAPNTAGAGGADRGKSALGTAHFVLIWHTDLAAAGSARQIASETMLLRRQNLAKTRPAPMLEALAGLDREASDRLA